MASESESEKRETSADVADEIRRAVESMGDEIPYTVSAGTMRRVAERIEAAWKRQEKTYLDQIRDAMNMWGHEKHIAEHAQKPTVGNAAAMHEALEKIYSCAIGCNNYNLDIAMDKVIEIAKAALSAPPRNCDKTYRNKCDLIGRYVSETEPTIVSVEGFIDWFTAPAAERKGECDAQVVA